MAFIASHLAFFTPQSGGSPNADEIASLYKIVLYIAIVIFVAVEGALLYTLVKFRKRKGAVAAQIHGNTRLEIAWTAGAAVILVVLAVITFVKLSAIQNPPNSGPEGAALASDGTLYASAKQAAPQRQGAEHHRRGPSVHLAVRLPGRQRSRRPGRALLV